MADQHNDNIPAVANTIAADIPDIKENLEWHKDCFEAICTGWSNTVTTDLAVDLLAATVTRIVGAGTIAQGADITAALHRKIVEIGDWDMDTTGTVSVAHGVTAGKIRTISVLIRLDASDTVVPLDYAGEDAADGSQGSWYATSVNVILYRKAAGQFDSTGYNATTYNRGWIIIDYTD